MPLYGTAGDIMDSSAALLNDVAKQIYTYVNQFPYLKIALRDFQELAQLNNVPVTNKTSTVLLIPAGATVVSSVTTPALPTDLVEIQTLYEGSLLAGPFYEMGRREFLPTGLSLVAAFGIFSWANNEIQFPAATGDIYLKIDYISTLFSGIIDENSTLSVINADSFITYRLGGLCAEFIGENKERADSLNGNAQLALDRILGIENKARQGIPTRRRHFRSK